MRMEDIRDFFNRKVGEKREAVTEALAQGRATDYADYQRMVGLLQGLEFATNVVEDLAERLEEDEDNVD